MDSKVLDKLISNIKILLDINNANEDKKISLLIDFAIENIQNYLSNVDFDNKYITENFQNAIIKIVTNSYTNSKNKGLKSVSQGARRVEFADTSVVTGTIVFTSEVKALLPKPFLKMR